MFRKQYEAVQGFARNAKKADCDSSFAECGSVTRSNVDGYRQRQRKPASNSFKLRNFRET